MDILDADVYSLKNLSAINILVGKNGCGKSSALRAVDRHRDKIPSAGHIAYITPERAGTLDYLAHIEHDMVVSPQNVGSNRRNNQFAQFKPQSVVQYRRLQTMVSNEVDHHVENELPGKPTTFGAYVKRLNTLLDEVQVVKNDTAFSVVKKGSDTVVPTVLISSGESELISLGIECLVFEKEMLAGKTNMLLLDEPDVHLHPDLQVRLMEFISAQVKAKGLRVVIATHSTAILGALRKAEGVSIAFMRAGQRELTFVPINERHRRILPMFGAHPLSNIFNEAPVLLVEGEDDERIWQQAVRTSQGRISIYPCVCDSVQELVDYEREVAEIITSVYDNARAYSLRDGDGNLEDLEDHPPVIRLRLRCYAAENLMLTNEVLSRLGTDWKALTAGIETWLTNNPTHNHQSRMSAFKASGYDRRNFKIKELRIDLMGIIGSDKPWEVVVGQTIGSVTTDAPVDFSVDGGLLSFIGEKATKALLRFPAA